MLMYFAIILVPLIGFCGLAIDVGRLELRKIQLQSAADAAALSAAAELQHASGTWKNAATTEVTANANLNGFPVPTIAVQQGATFAAYMGDNSVVEVTLTQKVSSTFLQVLGNASTTLTVRADAMIPPCIFLMGPGIPSRGNTDLALSSTTLNNLPCPTYAKDGYYVDGFSHICCTTPKTHAPASNSYGGGTTSPPIQSNSPLVTDPLAYVTAPTFSSCTYMNKMYTASTAPNNITPGTYCGGITVSSTTLNMAPGLYIITGGTNFTNSTITGSGVTLYLTKGGGSGFGAFSADHTTLNLSAPNDASGGGIPAVTIFGDRSWVGTNEDFSFVFSPLYGDGIVYTTGTGIYDWHSNLSGPDYFTIITANLGPTASAILPSANYNQLPGGDPLHMPIALVQ